MSVLELQLQAEMDRARRERDELWEQVTALRTRAVTAERELAALRTAADSWDDELVRGRKAIDALAEHERLQSARDPIGTGTDRERVIEAFRCGTNGLVGLMDDVRREAIEECIAYLRDNAFMGCAADVLKVAVLTKGAKPIVDIAQPIAVTGWWCTRDGCDTHNASTEETCRKCKREKGGKAR